MAKLYLDLLLLLIYRRLDWLAVPLAPGSTSLDISTRISFFCSTLDVPSPFDWMYSHWCCLVTFRTAQGVVVTGVPNRSVFPYCARKPLLYFNIIDYVVLWLFWVSTFALLRFHPRGAVTVLLFDDLLL